MRTLSDKIKFLNSVDADKISDRIREPYLELKDVSNDFTDVELLEGMTEIIDELIDAIADEQVVVVEKTADDEEDEETKTPTIKKFTIEEEKGNEPPKEISAETIGEKQEDDEDDEDDEDEIITETANSDATEEEIKINTEEQKPSKTTKKIKVINHTQECIDLKDEFLELLRTVINESCSTEAYPYACSMSQTEQGFEQLAKQVFDICISEKDMSIKSALNILESELNTK